MEETMGVERHENGASPSDDGLQLQHQCLGSRMRPKMKAGHAAAHAATWSRLCSTAQNVLVQSVQQ